MTQLRTYTACYKQALDHQQKASNEEDHTRIDPLDLNMPSCESCIYYADKRGEPEEWGKCRRYPKMRRVERAGICGEYVGEGVFVEQIS